MALTVSQLATAIRAGGSAQETEIVTRLLAVAVAQVMRYADNAPEDVRDEAAIRIAAYLYDMPNAGRNAAYASALRNSGASALLAQYRIHRAGNVAGAAMAAAAIGSDSNPVTGLAIAGDALVVTFADGSTVSLTLPAGMATGNPVTGLSLNGNVLTVTFADATTETITLPSPSAVDQTARDAAAAAQATADAHEATQHNHDAGARTAAANAQITAESARDAAAAAQSDADTAQTTAGQAQATATAAQADIDSHEANHPGGGGTPPTVLYDGTTTLAGGSAKLPGEIVCPQTGILEIYLEAMAGNRSNSVGSLKAPAARVYAANAAIGATYANNGTTNNIMAIPLGANRAAHISANATDHHIAMGAPDAGSAGDYYVRIAHVA